MGPKKAFLAVSESKARFFQRLGLDEQSEYDQWLYKMMKEEALEGRRRITASLGCLVVQYQDDTTVEPPYTYKQISVEAISREIKRIYNSARKATKDIYDLGRDIDNVEERNWVIDWMVWHVFRYRDPRNKNRTRGRSPDDDENDDDAVTATGSAMSDTSSRYWDPIRDD